MKTETKKYRLFREHLNRWLKSLTSRFWHYHSYHVLLKLVWTSDRCFQIFENQERSSKTVTLYFLSIAMLSIIPIPNIPISQKLLLGSNEMDQLVHLTFAIRVILPVFLMLRTCKSILKKRESMSNQAIIL